MYFDNSEQKEFNEFLKSKNISALKRLNMGSNELRKLQNEFREILRQRAIEENKKFEAIRRERERILAEERRKEEEERLRREEEERLAHVEEVTSMELPVDWTNIFDEDERTVGVVCESIADGLIKSLTELNRVDIEYISSITGEDYATVISTLKGSIYQNPETWDECFYKGWETADEFLSGQLKHKLEVTRKANEAYCGYFSDSLVALEKVMSPTVAAENIYITLGSPWVPSEIIDEFIADTFGDMFGYKRGGSYYRIEHDPLTGIWYIPNKNRYGRDIAVINTYGTKRLNALEILEKTLNMNVIQIKDTDNYGKTTYNQKDTIEALEKQQKLIKEFQRWVWSDKNRTEYLVDIYDTMFGQFKRRIFDGSFLEFPGKSDEISLYPYQKNAVARILFTDNTLLAHDVGSGKTYVMIAAGMELKRNGLSKKNMYVVPNSIVGQWRDIFYSMYPQANILVVEPSNFTTSKRKEMVERIRDEEFDAIIITYSCFDEIPISDMHHINELRAKKAELIDYLDKNRDREYKKIRAKLKKIEKELSEQLVKYQATDNICFEDLKINRLFIDEAHNFKNVKLDTSIRTVLGINSSNSNFCNSTMDKVKSVLAANDGKGIVLATGTPITNSITDIFVVQKFIQEGTLKFLGLDNFDNWVGMFAECATDFEVDVDTSKFRLATRFSRFHNLPELTALIANIADFHQVHNDLPDFDGYTDVLVPPLPEFKDYLKDISIRADKVRSGSVRRKEDNMLKITTDGRQAALDIRLVNPDVAYSEDFKIAKVVENVARIYFETEEKKLSQVLFCDSSTPKSNKFNVYDEIKTHLIEKGVPADQIRFIHDATNDKQRTDIFNKVRKGQIRIIIGSTSKLGVGVNIQDNLVALHHVDVPWRPADMTQREGRILRQGNTNNKIEIYRYITEGSFDAYSWQLLEIKQKFISELLSGSMDDRNGSDVKETALNYAEVKALAIGNPLVKKRVEVANELNRFKVLQQNVVETRLRLEQELTAIPSKISNQRLKIVNCMDDIEAYKEWVKTHPKSENGPSKAEREERIMTRNLIDSGVRNNALKTKEETLIDYRGFDIVLPTNMDPNKPYVWLVKSGRYCVDLGDKDVGNLIRIDNYLESLDKQLEKYQAILDALIIREDDIKAELGKNISYADDITKFASQLRKIDEELKAQ